MIPLTRGRGEVDQNLQFAAIFLHHATNSVEFIPCFQALHDVQHGVTLDVVYPMALSIRSRPIVLIASPQ